MLSPFPETRTCGYQLRKTHTLKEKPVEIKFLPILLNYFERWMMIKNRTIMKRKNLYRSKVLASGTMSGRPGTFSFVPRLPAWSFQKKRTAASHQSLQKSPTTRVFLRLHANDFVLQLIIRSSHHTASTGRTLSWPSPHQNPAPPPGRS